MSNTTAYSMLNVTATLDGRIIQGTGDGDDALKVEQGTDVGELMVGADGCSLFSQSADKSAKIILKLQHTSPTHRQLIEKWKAQRAGRLKGFPFDFIDSTSNEGGSADSCFIGSAPSDEKGEKASSREWTLVTGHWEPTTPNG